MIDEAIIFATKVHSGKKRKGKEIPYIFHPLEAAMIVSHMKQDEKLIVAAILHDTMEDASITYEEIQSRFGSEIATLVAGESEDKAKSWLERKRHTISRLTDERMDIKIIAMGDKLSNMRAIARDYSNLGDDVWQRFHVKDKELQGWYHKGIKDALIELKDYSEYQEYVNLCNQVFGQ